MEDGRRGLGGTGDLIETGEDGEEVSVEELRRAVGFLGGGGAGLPVLLATEGERWFAVSVCVSVLTRRRGGRVIGPSSSDDDRSMRLFAGSGVGWDGVRPGSLGLTLGWSASNCGNSDLDRRLLSSSSRSRREASIAAFSSGSWSSLREECTLTLLEEKSP